MKIPLALPILAVALAACADPVAQRPTVLRATAALGGPEAEVIEVWVSQIPPGTRVEQVVLIDPDGAVTAARETLWSDSESGPGQVSRPLIGIGVSGGSSGGIKPSLGLGWRVTGGGPSLRTSRLLARIPVADPEAYKSTAASWRVEVRYLDVTGAARVLSQAAPQSYQSEMPN